MTDNESIDWFSNVEGNLEGITLKEFEDLCQLGFSQKEVINTLEFNLKKEEEKLQTIKNNIMLILDKFGKAKQDTALGLVYISEKLSVSHPKEVEARAKFFEYLKSKGVFETLISVNSQTLNKLYREEREIALDEGKTDFNIPGIGEPTLIKTLNFRKGK